MTHHGDPATLLSLTTNVGQLPDEALVISIPASNLGMGFTFSSRTELAIGEAVDLIAAMALTRAPLGLLALYSFHEKPSSKPASVLPAAEAVVRPALLEHRQTPLEELELGHELGPPAFGEVGSQPLPRCACTSASTAAPDFIPTRPPDTSAPR